MELSEDKSNYVIIHVDNNVQLESMYALYVTVQLKKGLSIDFLFKGIFCAPPPLSSCNLFFLKETIKLMVTEVIVLGCLRVIHHPVVFSRILGLAWPLLLLAYVFFLLKMEE